MRLQSRGVVRPQPRSAARDLRQSLNKPVCDSLTRRRHGCLLVVLRAMQVRIKTCCTRTFCASRHLQCGLMPPS